jgi:hypothetical protein
VNLANVKDARVKADTISYLKMHTVLRMVVLKVMRENGIDAFVNPGADTPPYKLGMASEPEVDWRESNGCCQTFTAMMGAPEMEVPAGFTTSAYEPTYVLSATQGIRRDDRHRANSARTPDADQPHDLGGPGDEPRVIKLASAYEAGDASPQAPADFGPVAAKFAQAYVLSA